jgi:hypothetical protein
MLLILNSSGARMVANLKALKMLKVVAGVIAVHIGSGG